MSEIPSFITHYSRSEPFRSMSEVPAEALSDVVAGLSENEIWGLARYRHSDYWLRRRKVEARLRSDFIALGGAPVLEHPLYCFLGRNLRFEEHPLNRGYAIDLSEIQPNTITFTYGDSLLAFDHDYRKQSGERYAYALCARLFSHDRLSELFLNKPMHDPLHIEVQLWIKPTADIVRPL